MADIKWIKLTVDMFDDEKIKLIEKLPDADTILVVWIKLLTLAGRVNDGGLVYLGDRIAYTDEMLATIFNRPINTVRLALKTFETYGMIEINKFIIITNWEKHQNLDALDKIRQQTRERVARYRDKQKQLAEESSPDSNVTVTSSNDIEREREEEREEEREKDNTSPAAERASVPYQKIIDLFNKICVALPKVEILTDDRKKWIKARWQSRPDLLWWEEYFQRVQASDFLCGRTQKDPWTGCSFDWVIRPRNFAKIVEGNYDNKRKGGASQQKADKFRLLYE